MKKILFVCTGNTCRSPMAQAIFTELCQNKEFFADSAGISASGHSPLSKNAYLALKKRGIEFSHTSQKVDEQSVAQSFAVICMTRAHAAALCSQFPKYADKIFTFGHDIADPYGGDCEVYEACCDELYENVCGLLKELCAENDR